MQTKGRNLLHVFAHSLAANGVQNDKGFTGNNGKIKLKG
jgi:hypothetical protein